jgi:hypothetical protein
LDLNLYTYCLNNPIMYADPTGYHQQGQTLSYNQTYNKDVAELQEKLITLGYMAPIPAKEKGYFGNKTQEAVNNYKDTNLSSGNKGNSKGKVGDTTWAYIDRDYKIAQSNNYYPSAKSQAVSQANSQFNQELNKLSGKGNGSGGKAISSYSGMYPPSKGAGKNNKSGDSSFIHVSTMQVTSSSPYPSISAYGAKVEASGSYGIANGNVHTTVGLGEAYGKAVIGFEPNFNGTKVKGGTDKQVFGVDLRANAQVSAIEGGAYGQLGNNNFGIDGDAHGHIGTADAYAGFTARADGQAGLGVRAGAEASVFEGNLSGGITLFGYEIEVGVEGSAIGIGAKAELGIIDGKLKARAKAVAGLGGGLWFSVGEKK